jgi:hypothetical protein
VWAGGLLAGLCGAIPSRFNWPEDRNIDQFRRFQVTTDEQVEMPK